jgi:hypothetical protein
MRYAFVIIVGFALSGCVTVAGMAGVMTIASGAMVQYEEFQKEQKKLLVEE